MTPCTHHLHPHALPGVHDPFLLPSGTCLVSRRTKVPSSPKHPHRGFRSTKRSRWQEKATMTLERDAGPSGGNKRTGETIGTPPKSKLCSRSTEPSASPLILKLCARMHPYWCDFFIRYTQHVALQLELLSTLPSKLHGNPFATSCTRHGKEHSW